MNLPDQTIPLPLRLPTSSYAIVLVTLSFTMSQLIHALDWDGGAGAPNNTWQSDPSNWVGDSSPSPGDDLVFTGSTNVDTENDFAAGTAFGDITIDDSGSAAGNFILDGNSINWDTGSVLSSNTAAASQHDVKLDLALSGGTSYAIDTAANNEITISGNISGNSIQNLNLNRGTTVVTDDGTVILAGDNSGFEGNVFILGGTVRATNYNSLGVGQVTLNDSSSTNPTLVLDASAGSLSVNNNIVWANVNGAKTLSVEGGDAVITGNLTVNDVNNNDNLVNVAAGSTLTVTGNVEGPDGRLRMEGDGTLVFSGANTHTNRQLNIASGGTLVVDADVTTTTGFTFLFESTLAGTGTLGGTTSINSGVLSAGRNANEAGILNFDQNLTLTGPTVSVDWDLINASLASGTGSDAFELNGGNLNFNSDVIQFNINDLDGGVFDNLDGLVSATSQEFLVWSGYSNLVGFDPSEFVFNYTGTSANVSSSNFSIFQDTTVGSEGVYLQFSAVPEPSTYALLSVLMGGLVFLRWKKVREARATNASS